MDFRDFPRLPQTSQPRLASISSTPPKKLCAGRGAMRCPRAPRRHPFHRDAEADRGGAQRHLERELSKYRLPSEILILNYRY